MWQILACAPSVSELQGSAAGATRSWGRQLRAKAWQRQLPVRNFERNPQDPDQKEELPHEHSRLSTQTLRGKVCDRSPPRQLRVEPSPRVVWHAHALFRILPRASSEEPGTGCAVRLSCLAVPARTPALRALPRLRVHAETRGPPGAPRACSRLLRLMSSMAGGKS